MRAPAQRLVAMAATVANARLAGPTADQRRDRDVADPAHLAADPAADAATQLAADPTAHLVADPALGSSAEDAPGADESTVAAWVTSLLVALAAAVGSVLYLTSAWRYSLGSLRSPGPGLFPFAAGIIVLVGLVWYIVTHAAAFQRVRGRRASRAGAYAVLRVAVTIAAGLFYVFASQSLNDILVAAVSGLAVMVVAGQRLWLALAVACATGIAAHYVFVVALGVPVGHGSSL